MSSRRTPLDRGSASYGELAEEVRRSGLLERRQGWYWGTFLVLVLTATGLGAVAVRLGDTWWQLVVAAVSGVLLAQVGFLGHDAAHRQVFAGAAWNEWSARVLSGGVAGLSYSWWRGKHNRHHAAPNQEGRDPDVAPGLLVFTATLAAARPAGLAGWFQRHQGWLFFPLLTLEGLNLHVASLRELLGRAPVRRRWPELALVLARHATYVGLLVWLLPVPQAVAFLAVQEAVFGLCLGASFAPNHKGMPIVPPLARIDFLRRQVLMSRNVRGGPVVDVAMGGLNYQIEHHLFPSLPRPHLPRVQPIVREHCRAHGIPYTELGLLASYGVVVRYLNDVGLRARGPFDCPLAGDLRTGALGTTPS